MQQPAEDPFDYISGPEGGSLLIYERICPTAAPDPIMSRRVFDVGLDIGRIKNGIHRRQENKRTKSGRSASASEANHEKSSDNRQLIPRLPRRKSIPKLINLERLEAPPFPVPDSPEKVTIAEDIPIPPASPKEAHMPSEPESNTQTDLLPLTSSQAEESVPLNFDLNPPAPRKSFKMVDNLSERIFSSEHLRVILGDPTFFMRFTAFLNRYKPECSPLLVRYLEAQKAIKAVEYANALAESMKPMPGDETSNTPCTAATIDARFEERSKRAFDTLVNEALPAYVTFHLVKVVTESMVREITGTALPLMRELVGGLAEVFCLADPSLPDTPIVYASEGTEEEILLCRLAAYRNRILPINAVWKRLRDRQELPVSPRSEDQQICHREAWCSDKGRTRGFGDHIELVGLVPISYPYSTLQMSNSGWQRQRKELLSPLPRNISADTSLPAAVEVVNLS